MSEYNLGLTPETEKLLLNVANDGLEDDVKCDFITQVLTQSNDDLMDLFVSPVNSQNNAQEATATTVSNDPTIQMQQKFGPYNLSIDVVDIPTQRNIQNHGKWKNHVTLRDRQPYMVFADINRCFTIKVNMLSMPPRGSRFRIFPQYMSTDASAAEAVYCCPRHMKERDKTPSSSTSDSSQQEVAVSQQSLQQRSMVEAASPAAKYQFNPQGLPKALCLLYDLEALSVPVQNHQCPSFHIPLKFTCFNSCPRGCPRQGVRMQLWLTLECPSADFSSVDGFEICGVDHIEFKACASPCRDSAAETTGIAKVSKVPRLGMNCTIRNIRPSVASSSSGAKRGMSVDSSFSANRANLRICNKENVPPSLENGYVFPKPLTGSSIVSWTQQQPHVDVAEEGDFESPATSNTHSNLDANIVSEVNASEQCFPWEHSNTRELTTLQLQRFVLLEQLEYFQRKNGKL